MSQSSTPAVTDAIYDASSLGRPRMFVLGLQHMFAMFGATVLVPVLTGLSVSATLLFAGIGTLLFHFLSRGKVPAFLGSSFAFIAGYAAIAPNGEAELLPYACLGVACAGLLYPVLAALFRAFGAKRVMRFFPPVVTGPIVISIGLILASSAIANCQTNWLVAVIAVAVIITCNIWGRGMVKIVPILLGVVVSYAVAAVLGEVDFSGVAAAPWVGLPIVWDNTVFALFGAPANTTYGENTGVLALTRVFDPCVIRIAACCAIVLSFCPKFAAVIAAMPACVIGGVSLVLYGMISAVGVRNLIENQVDFQNNRNVLVAALVLVLSLGIAYSTAGAIVLELGGVTISLSGLAVGSLVGIVLNAILPGNDFEFDTSELEETAE